MERTSKKQRDLLNFIAFFIEGHGYGPSYREIMRALNYKSVSTVAVHVDNLIKKGWLKKRTRSARSLEVLSTALAPTKSTKITAEQEKWLVDLVFARFDVAERAPNAKAIDELYVLTGALQILGLADATTAAKSRLKDILRKK
jgi:repressor LexA